MDKKLHTTLSSSITIPITHNIKHLMHILIFCGPIKINYSKNFKLKFSAKHKYNNIKRSQASTKQSLKLKY